ncbi:ATP synthase subunit I [Vibrio methylphosphonaticus]|uniref:ATP synthase subunit I n=1 Tax=Vibrio methylphosphonaticus TaxID=2946866 RepID=UPI002029D66A|nr:ATP synthase subunit I [Vibrio methylphosphonaticus]MCL9773617.1 ATP synthase subunit I [Vibrio methylphosphonaticus]
MEANMTGDDIMLAGKRILYSQLIIGSIFILYETFFKDKINLESALTGMVIAIVPSLIGMIFASFKAKYKPKQNLNDLMQLSRNIKIIYTIVMFVLTFRFMALRNVTVLAAYCITVLGFFISPLFKDKQENF